MAKGSGTRGTLNVTLFPRNAVDTLRFSRFLSAGGDRRELKKKDEKKVANGGIPRRLFCLTYKTDSYILHLQTHVGHYVGFNGGDS